MSVDYFRPGTPQMGYSSAGRMAYESPARMHTPGSGQTSKGGLSTGTKDVRLFSQESRPSNNDSPMGPPPKGKSNWERNPLQQRHNLAFPPTTEIALSRSQSSPELTLGKKYPSWMIKVSDTAVHAALRARIEDEAVAEEHEVNSGRPQLRPLAYTFSGIGAEGESRISHMPTNSYQTHSRQRSRSDNHKSTSGFSNPTFRHSTATGIEPTTRSRTSSRMMIDPDLYVGEIPEYPAPHLPPDIEALGMVARRKRCEKPTISHTISISSMGSANSTDLEEEIHHLTPKNRQGSADHIVRPLSTSLSSRMSDGLSIYERGTAVWDNVVSAGLSSPSKRRTQSLSRKAQSCNAGYDNPARHSLQPSHDNVTRHSLQTSGSGRLIREGSRVSLGTLGGRRYSQNRASGVLRHVEALERRRDSGASVDFVPATPPPTPQDSGSSRNLPVEHIGRANSAKHILRPGLQELQGSEEVNMALREISGNQTDFLQSSRQSREPKTLSGDQQNLFNWDLKTAGAPQRPVSALKGGSMRRKGHRRQNCVRISTLAPIVFNSYACSPMSEKSEHTPSPRLPSKPRRHGLHTARPLPIPPSTATFAPQISPTPRRSVSNDMLQSQSPTLSRDIFYSPVDNRSPSEDEFFAPRRSSSHRYSTDSDVFNSPPSSRPMSSLTTPADLFSAIPTILPVTGPSGSLSALKETRPAQNSDSPMKRASAPTQPPPVQRNQRLLRPRSLTVVRGPRTPPFGTWSYHRHERQQSLAETRRASAEVRGLSVPNRSSSNADVNHQSNPSQPAEQRPNPYRSRRGTGLGLNTQELRTPPRWSVGRQSWATQDPNNLTASRRQSGGENPMSFVSSGDDIYDLDGFLRS